MFCSFLPNANKNNRELLDDTENTIGINRQLPRLLSMFGLRYLILPLLRRQVIYHLAVIARICQLVRLRLAEPERYLVQLDTPALYPQLEQELRVQQPEQLAPEQALSHDSWQQLSFSQISAAQARIQNEQQLATIQIQSRFPQVRVTGQFSQLENALTVTLTAPNKQQLATQIAQLPGVKAVYPEQLVQGFFIAKCAQN